MEILENIYNIVFEVMKILFVHDIENCFYVISVFVIVSIIVISLLFRTLGYKK